MAAPMINKHLWKIMNILLIFGIILSSVHCQTQLYEFTPSGVLSAIDNVCLLLVDINSNEGLLEKFNELKNIFANEESVFIGSINLKTFQWSNGNELHWKLTNTPVQFRSKDIVFFPKKVVDRTCLYHPNKILEPSGEYFEGPAEIQTLVEFLNSKCSTYLQPNGLPTQEGMHREDILNNIFRMSDVSDMTMEKIYSTHDNPLNESYQWKQHQDDLSQGQCDSVDCEKSQENLYKQPRPASKLHTCDRISLPLSDEDFFTEYVQRSRPVIISGAATQWEAFNKWTNDYLRQMYGNETVHIKLTPGGDFEGVEPIDLWENYHEFTSSIPEEVFKSLKFPDLVVVRPAGVNMKFEKFLDLITWASSQETRNVSAYLEYSSIPTYMPQLQEDLEEFPFIKKLKLKHLNMWLSDGNTLGRLHFDPYDNLLCQLRGKKQVLLFEPFNNENLYESHIQQATLSYNSTGHRFRRKQLEESTSMVMSPVDVLNPDFQRFPRFADVVPLNCTISEGDVLFMPSFWWHEVKSSPNVDEKRNLAVNFWYEPFLTKEFPCPECRMDVNSFYHHLL